ncbi:hypothetical protein B7767_38260 [Streptomyces sp. 13-12-16]|nr:hypothetical protein B7767_38260 [Streptomyces sp. 13-12-16]
MPALTFVLRPADAFGTDAPSARPGPVRLCTSSSGSTAGTHVRPDAAGGVGGRYGGRSGGRLRDYHAVIIGGACRALDGFPRPGLRLPAGCFRPFVRLGPLFLGGQLAEVADVLDLPRPGHQALAVL